MTSYKCKHKNICCPSRSGARCVVFVKMYEVKLPSLSVCLRMSLAPSPTVYFFYWALVRSPRDGQTDDARRGKRGKIKDTSPSATSTPPFSPSSPSSLHTHVFHPTPCIHTPTEVCSPPLSLPLSLSLLPLWHGLSTTFSYLLCISCIIEAHSWKGR